MLKWWQKSNDIYKNKEQISHEDKEVVQSVQPGLGQTSNKVIPLEKI